MVVFRLLPYYVNYLFSQFYFFMLHNLYVGGIAGAGQVIRFFCI